MSATIHVTGFGLWSPGIPSVATYLARGRDDAAERPACEIVQSRMKRATSLLTQMSVEVMTQAARDAGYRLDEVATIFGSTHGEIQIAVEQMQMMQEGSGVVSPARFKNSVHNTAAGLFSISAGNRGFNTAIAAGEHTFAMSLLEAWTLLTSGEQARVLVSIAEEPLPPPIARCSEHVALAVALALSTDPAGSRATLSCPAPGEGKRRHVPPAFRGHSAEGALGLLDAIDAGEEGSFALDDGWLVELGPRPDRVASP
ncbi:MAG: beta-ketoacyl synthase chain length factor [Myxococcales bacterium]|nr:beta-ketoacyl synthase chain length factor [Myxococcales bacterium]